MASSPTHPRARSVRRCRGTGPSRARRRRRAPGDATTRASFFICYVTVPTRLPSSLPARNCFALLPASSSLFSRSRPHRVYRRVFRVGPTPPCAVRRRDAGCDGLAPSTRLTTRARLRHVRFRKMNTVNTLGDGFCGDKHARRLCLCFFFLLFFAVIDNRRDLRHHHHRTHSTCKAILNFWCGLFTLQVMHLF